MSRAFIKEDWTPLELRTVLSPTEAEREAQYMATMEVVDQKKAEINARIEARERA